MSESIAINAPSPRATLKRLPDRGHYDRETIHAILDEGLIAHVGVVVDGAPRVIPFVYARVGDNLYLHGSTGNCVMRTLRDGAPGCLTVTHLDGLVLARSAFHHSVNYRSVVVHAHGEEVEDPDERRRALDATIDHVAPGRSTDVRPPNDAELRRTMVMRFPIGEASAKIRRGEPIDDPEDLALPHWAGVVPMQQAFGDPRGDALLREGIDVPDYLVSYVRPGRGR